MTEKTLLIDVSATFMETPPRCRKARPVTHELQVPVSIPCPSLEEAPVAAVIHWEAFDEVFHLFDEGLWGRLHSHETFPPGHLSFGWEPTTEEELPQKVKREVDVILLNGETPLRRRMEPVWAITNSHYFSRPGHCIIGELSSLPPRAPWWNTFNLNEEGLFRQAIDELSVTLREKYEEEGVFSSSPKETVEVLIPGAFKFRRPSPEEFADLVCREAEINWANSDGWRVEVGHLSMREPLGKVQGILRDLLLNEIGNSGIEKGIDAARDLLSSLEGFCRCNQEALRCFRDVGTEVDEEPQAPS